MLVLCNRMLYCCLFFILGFSLPIFWKLFESKIVAVISQIIDRNLGL